MTSLKLLMHTKNLFLMKDLRLSSQLVKLQQFVLTTYSLEEISKNFFVFYFYMKRQSAIIRRINAASSGIKSLYISKASLTSEFCMHQCHHFMTIIITNLKILLSARFSTLQSIAYCLSLSKTTRMFGSRPTLSHVVQSICDLPLTCRLFEVAHLCKDSGHYGEFELVLLEIKSRALNEYLYNVAKSYFERWEIPNLIEEMIYEEGIVESVLDKLFTHEDNVPWKLEYFINILIHNDHTAYSDLLVNYIDQCNELDMISMHQNIELLILKTLKLNRNPATVLKTVFSFLLKNIDYSSETLQSVYGYIKAVECKYGYSEILEFLKTFKTGMPKSMLLFFESSLNSKYSENVCYRDHPHFLLLLDESMIEIMGET
eukprot:NODE_31_length_32452_cov_0.352672.p6 type:complete len:373 gc:universal NODE_31_length_32452_cov_0.352672:10873-11991(+)